MGIRPARIAACGWLLLAALPLIACGEATTSAPPPETVATADAQSRPVTIAAPFATTPVADDTEAHETVVLEGHVFGSGPVGVILAPARTADQSAWFPFALVLAATGKFTVLTFDFRGFGGSTGEKEFDHLDTDLTAAYEYATETLGMRRIFLAGASTGGSAALVVSARLPVAGVVSISSAAQFQTLDALDAVTDIAAPKLFVTSEKDVPAARSQEQFWQSATDPRQQQVYDGNANGTDIFAGPHRMALEQLMLGFLTSH